MTISTPSGRGPFVRRTELPGLLRSVQPANGPVSSPGTSLNPATHCLVKNDSGAARDIYAVLKLGNALITNSDNSAAYQHGVPLHSAAQFDEDDQETLCILQEPAANDSSLIRAVYSGVSLVRLIGATGKKCATTRDGATTLEAADSGPCVILYDPGPANVERIARVRITSVKETCPEVDVLTLFGPITGGTVTVRYRLQDVTADAIWDWDTDAETAQSTLISAHSKINSGDVFVVGGPWPTIALHVIWDGQYKGKTVNFPAVIPDLDGSGTCSCWKASSSNWRGYY